MIRIDKDVNVLQNSGLKNTTITKKNTLAEFIRPLISDANGPAFADENNISIQPRFWNMAINSLFRHLMKILRSFLHGNSRYFL